MLEFFPQFHAEVVCILMITFPLILKLHSPLNFQKSLLHLTQTSDQYQLITDIWLSKRPKFKDKFWFGADTHLQCLKISDLEWLPSCSALRYLIWSGYPPAVPEDIWCGVATLLQCLQISDVEWLPACSALRYLIWSGYLPAVPEDIWFGVATHLQCLNISVLEWLDACRAWIYLIWSG
jgi:hypothetical protein